MNINKIIVTLVVATVVVGAVLTATMLNKSKEEEQQTEEEVKKEVSEVILDECTQEYEEFENEGSITTNSEEEKISPSCKLTITKHYSDCNDEINEYKTVPDSLVNKTKEDLQALYNDFEVKEFSANQVTLYKEIQGECGEHFLLKDDDGTIAIYKILENGEEELYEKTEISTDYLTQIDSADIKNGLRVNGKEELNELIESFE